MTCRGWLSCAVFAFIFNILFVGLVYSQLSNDSSQELELGGFPEGLPPPVRAKWNTDTQARLLNLRIPAPRGAILDRHGKMLAQSIVRKNLAFRFKKYASEQEAWEDFKTQVQQLGPNKQKGWEHTLNRLFSFKKSDVIDHYKNRRWFPFELIDVLSSEEEERVSKRLELLSSHSFILESVYSRIYPEGKFASHIVGRIGADPAPKSDKEIPSLIQGREKFLDPFFIEWSGREGVESKFDDLIKGQDGLARFYIDSDGHEVYRQMVERPQVGQSIVTTIDLEWQKVARAALEKKAKRGSFLLMDNRTGELLVAVSTPSVDPNVYVPNIKEKDFAAIRDNPNNPLLARAWQGQYPPGSTFKPLTALTAFENNLFGIPWYRDGVDDSLGTYASKWTRKDCPMDIQVGNNVFPNWYRKGSEGVLDVFNALARSCNTYFVPLGVELGSEKLIKTATRFGFGKTTGLDLDGEAEGAIPVKVKKNPDGTEEKVYFGPAHAANLSIGQGEFLVTPLQLLRVFSALATGGQAPTPKLVKQAQTEHQVVTQDFLMKEQNYLDPGLRPNHLRVLERGLMHVVHSSRGTGQYARSNKVVVAGKTGTAQWKHKDQYAVWFAGYVSEPNEYGGYDTPYSFVVSVEGDRGQSMGGATFCAPAVKELLDFIYKDKELPFVANVQDFNLKGGQPLPGDYPPGDRFNGIEERYYSDPSDEGGRYYRRERRPRRQQQPSYNYGTSRQYYRGLMEN